MATTINTLATVPASLCQTIRTARAHADKASRQGLKKDIFGLLKAQYGIPADMPLKVDVDPASDAYGVLKCSKTNTPFPLLADGKWAAAARPEGTHKWFKIEAADVLQHIANYADDLINDTDLDWDDGSTTPPADVIGTVDNVSLAPGGSVWVHLDRDTFDGYMGY